MKKQKITSMLDFIQVQEKTNDIPYGTFYMQEREQFIDINNLQRYTIKELIIISGRKITGAKKIDYINFILRHKRFIEKQTKINREILLKSFLD